MSEVEEVAKAAAETAKLGQEVVKQLGPVERIARKILGPFGEAYGLLTDLTRHSREEINWRLENRKKIFRLAYEKAAVRHLGIEDLRPIPPRIAFDYEHHLAAEDDETLQQLWANLLVNVAAPNGEEPSKSFRKVLQDLDPDDALFLSEIGLRTNFFGTYFIVGSAQFNGHVDGCQIAPTTDAEDPTAVPSSDLWIWDAKGESFFSPWSDERVNVVVDRLQSAGVLYRTKELTRATEIFESELANYPTKDLAEFGQRILQHSEGVDTFGLSALGSAFLRAVSPHR